MINSVDTDKPSWNKSKVVIPLPVCANWSYTHVNTYNTVYKECLSKVNSQTMAVYKRSQWGRIPQKPCLPVVEFCGGSVGVNNSSDPSGGGGCWGSWRSSWRSSCCWCSGCSPSFCVSGRGGGGTAEVGEARLTPSSSIGVGSGRGAEGKTGVDATGASGSIRLRRTCTFSSNCKLETQGGKC